VTTIRQIETILIPAGAFIMGDDNGRPDERPAHRVTLSAFRMAVLPVTNEEYAAYLAATGHEPPRFWDEPAFNRPRQPVVGASWFDAVAYCDWLSSVHGARFRLPTEAEWEKAARGTDGRLYPWGNDPPTPLHANYAKIGSNSHGTLLPVGTMEAGKSPYGVYDMAGNVWEWVSDWYDNDFYKNSPSQNPTGPPRGGFKVIRGGSWNSNPRTLRSADRYWDPPSFRSLYAPGFRCAKTP